MLSGSNVSLVSKSEKIKAQKTYVNVLFRTKVKLDTRRVKGVTFCKQKDEGKMD